MIELLPVAIGVGLAVSLLFTEMFGIAAGGMVVPGYLALNLTHPANVLLTVAAGFATFLVVHTLSSFVIIYGRRRTVLMILVGYLIGVLVRFTVGGLHVGTSELTIIGYIIPGLIAIWLDRQGVVETLAALTAASVVVRLLLILLVGSELAVG
jgi:gamma-polyglutamate biosynthesis protein CapC